MSEDDRDYPAAVSVEEQRRAYVLNAIGGAASEVDAATLCQMVIEIAEMLRNGVPPTSRRLRPVR